MLVPVTYLCCLYNLYYGNIEQGVPPRTTISNLNENNTLVKLHNKWHNHLVKLQFKRKKEA